MQIRVTVTSSYAILFLLAFFFFFRSSCSSFLAWLVWHNLQWFQMVCSFDRMGSRACFHSKSNSPKTSLNSKPSVKSDTSFDSQTMGIKITRVRCKRGNWWQWHGRKMMVIYRLIPPQSNEPTPESPAKGMTTKTPTRSSLPLLPLTRHPSAPPHVTKKNPSRGVTNSAPQLNAEYEAEISRSHILWQKFMVEPYRYRYTVVQKRTRPYTRLLLSRTVGQGQ